MTGDPYFGFIFAAYAVAATVITAMIVVTLSNYRSLRRALERLSARTGRSAED
jgi:heme exporter protein CcmD